MIKAKWTLLLLFLLQSNILAVDMSGTSFVDYIRFVSNTSNINIIIDEEIDTKFSLILPNDYKSKDSFKVLKSILHKNDMYLVRYGSVYYIKKTSKDKKYHSVKLKFLLPDKIIPIIKMYHKDIIVSKSKKTIIFKSDNKESKEIKNLIDLLDKSTKSKKVKITLISFQDDDLKEFGLNIDTKASDGLNSLEYKTLIKGLSSSQTLFLNIPSFSLDMYLSDLKTSSIIDFKFSPILSLFDNEKTDFQITSNIPYLSEDRAINGTNDIESNSFQYKDVGSKINIDKVAVTDEDVYFHINMQYEIILDKTLTPTTAKRSIDNYIKLKNGESIMIAGLKGTEARTLHREIPILAAIPLLGEIFKWDSDSIKKETFAIFISNVDNNESFTEPTSEPTLGVPPRSGGKVGEKK
ncbi:type II secretion system protein GspD [Sulfurimonas sp.]|uniref:type II secretion system protein GspD n=1 Tax=Sulfurimonas sp. TaxID=2022749 RepID=UPI00356A40C1